MTGEDAPRVETPEPEPAGERGVRFAEWPTVERVLRSAFAVWFAFAGLMIGWDHLHHARFVDDYTVVLRDASAGRLEQYAFEPATDDVLPDGYRPRGVEVIRWRTSHGEYVASVRDDASLRDQLAAIAGVPRGEHPAERPIRHTPWWDRVRLANLVVLVMVVAGPQPRLCTRWGWFFLTSTVVGTVPFLLAGGSCVTGRVEPAARRRLRGIHALLIAAVLYGGAHLAYDTTNGAFTPPPAPAQAFVAR